MKIYFIRNTHDINGTFEEKFRQVQLDTVGLDVHGLNRSQERTTLEEFVQAHKDYERDFPECACPSVEALLIDLVKMIKAGTCRVELCQ